MYIFIIEKAREIPIARVRPSGTATTYRTTIRLICYGSFWKSTPTAESPCAASAPSVSPPVEPISTKKAITSTIKITAHEPIPNVFN